MQGTIDLFWRPDTFFVGEKQSANFRSTSDQYHYLALEPQGEVLRSVR